MEREVFKTTISNGAKEGSVHIQTYEKTPIKYVKGKWRYQIKAVGTFSNEFEKKKGRIKEWTPSECQLEMKRDDTYSSVYTNEFDPEQAKRRLEKRLDASSGQGHGHGQTREEEEEKEKEEESPYGRRGKEKGVWELTTKDVEYLALGCGVLGCGGGGSPYTLKQILLRLLKDGSVVKIVDPCMPESALDKNEMIIPVSRSLSLFSLSPILLRAHKTKQNKGWLYGSTGHRKREINKRQRVIGCRRRHGKIYKEWSHGESRRYDP